VLDRPGQLENGCGRVARARREEIGDMFGWIVIITVTALIVVGTFAKLVQIVTGRAWCKFCSRSLPSGIGTCPSCEQTQPWADPGAKRAA
jgi:hypothetical protein